MTLIRDATVKDCASCARLSRIPELKVPDGSYLSEDYFGAFIDSDRMFFVADDEGVKGYVLGEPLKGGVALLGLLAVDPDMRGQGLGKKLVERFRLRCDELGFQAILFYAPAFNRDTLAFYEKRGFIRGKEYAAFLDVRGTP